MKKKVLMLLAMLMCLFLFIVSAIAAITESYEIEVTNNINIGDVSIRLDEYTLDESGNEIPWTNTRQVLPGDMVDKIVRITNEANTVWIRAEVGYSSQDGITDIGDDMIHIIDDAWIKIDDCYYYTKPVEKDSVITLFDKVAIPAEWNSDYADKGFEIEIRVDAVQTANFTPDFRSDDPWFGTLIEECVHTEHSQIEESDAEFSVIFENDAEGFVRIGDDFFSNFAQLMPGEIVLDTVKVGNNYSSPVTITFRTDFEISEDEITAELLTKIQLKITMDNKVVYEGGMTADVLKNGIELVTLQTGESGIMEYTLSVPAEFTNKYALSGATVKWIFGTQLAANSEISSDNENTTSNSEVITDSEKTPVDSETSTDSGKTPVDNETSTDSGKTPVDSETSTDSGKTQVDNETSTDSGKTLTDNETPADNGKTITDGETSSGVNDGSRYNGVPKTGDTTNIMLYVFMMVVSLVGVVVIGRKMIRDV